MDQLTPYRQIIQEVLKPYADITYAYTNVRNRLAFDIHPIT